jgi:hypothetical protein
MAGQKDAFCPAMTTCLGIGQNPKVLAVALFRQIICSMVGIHRAAIGR